ncbi:MAG: hypothetical protein QGI60_01495, partial [archaeon]|nr:hypothetical protein [archaeon]
DSSVILADIKKALKEGKSLSEFAEKYGSAKTVKKPAPKSHKPTANIRLAGLLERIKTPEAQILALLRDPNRRAEVTKIFDEVKLTNTDKVVAKIENELAAGKTFKQMANKLRAGKSK